MHNSLFFRLFPPPKYMAMRYAGLEICDDAIRCLQYKPAAHGLVIDKHDQVSLPAGVMEGGDVKDPAKLMEALKAFDDKNDLNYVCVSIPEEKAYLFQTDVVGDSVKDIAQNIEFKLEENVPLAAQDAIFYFDILPIEATGGVLRASVSVVPRSYIEKQVAMLQSAGLFPIAFEVAPKSIARTAIGDNADRTSMIIHIMNQKTGIYIVSAGVVCFTSTVTNSDISNEANRTYEYWSSRGLAHMPIKEVVLTGCKASEYKDKISIAAEGTSVPVTIAETWKNAFDVNKYVPPINAQESPDYIVAAGLALEP